MEIKTAKRAEQFLHLLLYFKQPGEEFHAILSRHPKYEVRQVAAEIALNSVEMGMEEPKDLEGWSEHTLRKFKAPWVKKSYRRQVKYFCFYYFPYSGVMEQNCTGATFLGRMIERIYRLVFENALLRKLAQWRVKGRSFRFPIDAMFAIQGRRIKSLYGRLVHKNVDVFHEFDS